MGGNKKVVIVGGGFAGVKTALELANKPGLEVQLISDNTHFEYRSALYRSTISRSPLEVVMSLKEILAHAKNVDIRLDKIGFIDLDKRRLAGLDGDIYEYDQLVLALGNTTNYYGVQGAAENSYSLHTVTGVIKLRNQINDLVKDAIQSRRKKPLTLAIIGAGTAGVELAGELPNFIKFLAKRYKVKIPQPHIVLIENTNSVLPNFESKISNKALLRLKKIDIKVYLKTFVLECAENSILLNTGSLPVDLTIWSTGSRPVDFYKRNAEVFPLKANGKVAVNQYLRLDNYSNIHVLGDNAATPYSGMAQTALYDGRFVAKNIVRELNGKSPLPYRPRSPHVVVPIGKGWAISRIGGVTLAGKRAWPLRYRDEALISKNFAPYKEAIRTWHEASKLNRF